MKSGGKRREVKEEKAMGKVTIAQKLVYYSKEEQLQILLLLVLLQFYSATV